MKFVTAIDRRPGRKTALRRPIGAARRHCHCSAFTLAEVLAALMFMAIVIPVVVEALHVASLSGEIATRKAEATRVADRILNESIVTTNWTSASGGTVVENGNEFRWTMKTRPWPEDSAMQLVGTEVTFSARGKQYSVTLNTLASVPTITGTTAQQ